MDVAEIMPFKVIILPYIHPSELLLQMATRLYTGYPENSYQNHFDEVYSYFIVNKLFVSILCIFRDGRKLLIAAFKYCAQFDPILYMLSELFQEY